MEKAVLLKDASLLDENGQCTLHQDVYIKNGRIEKIAETGKEKFPEAEKVISCPGFYVTPGIPNLHTHTAMNIFKGIAEDVTADAWFNEMIWPYESKMTDEDVYTGTLLGIAEMLNNGVTVFADHYFGEEHVLRAVKETGIRGDLAPTLFGATEEFPERLSEVSEFIRNHREDSDKISFHMGPHAVYTCPDPTLGQIVDEAKKLNVPLHMHISEEGPQVEKTREKTGLTPFGVMARAGGFELPVLVGHGLWIEEEDLKLINDDTCLRSVPKHI